jgi:hypothetical protein
MIVRLRSTFTATAVGRWSDYATEETKAVEVWSSPDFADERTAIDEMRAVAALAEARERPVLHIIYSFEPQEQITLAGARALMDRLHDRLLEPYKAKNPNKPVRLLFRAAPHGDAHCRHVHEALVRIDADSGELLIDHRPLALLLRDFSQQNSPAEIRALLVGPDPLLTGRLRDAQVWNGTVTLARWLRPLVSEAATPQEHDNLIAAFGITRQPRGRGFVYVDANGPRPIAVALSHVLHPAERRRLEPWPLFAPTTRKAYLSYAERLGRLEMVDEALPDRDAAWMDWSLRRSLGQQVGRLGEYARRGRNSPKAEETARLGRESVASTGPGPMGRSQPILALTPSGMSLLGIEEPNANQYRRFGAVRNGTVDEQLHANIEDVDLRNASDLAIVDEQLSSQGAPRIVPIIRYGASAEEHPVKASIKRDEILETIEAELLAHAAHHGRDAAVDARAERLSRLRDAIAHMNPQTVFTLEKDGANRLVLDDNAISNLQEFANIAAPTRLPENDRAEAFDRLSTTTPLNDLLRVTARDALDARPTWRSLYDELNRHEITYGVYQRDGKLRGGFFELAGNNVPWLFIADAETLDASLGLESLQRELGIFVQPTHPAVDMLRDERQSANRDIVAPGVSDTLIGRFDRAYEERAPRGEQSETKVQDWARSLLAERTSRAGQPNAPHPDIQIRAEVLGQNSIGQLPVRQNINTIGDEHAPVKERRDHPMLQGARDAFERSLEGTAEREDRTEQILAQYQSDQRRASRRLDQARNAGETSSPLRARREELTILQGLAIAQEEATIGLAFANSWELKRPTLRDFIETWNGVDEAQRRELRELIRDEPEFNITPREFRYDVSLVACLNTDVRDVDDGIAYVAANNDRTRFFEKDDRFYLRRNPNSEDIDVALRTAEARYGAVDITGDDRFVERALRRAVELGIPVGTERLRERADAIRIELDKTRTTQQVARGEANVSVLLPEWAKLNQPLSRNIERGADALAAQERERLEQLVSASSLSNQTLSPEQRILQLGKTQELIDGTFIGVVQTRNQANVLVNVAGAIAIVKMTDSEQARRDRSRLRDKPITIIDGDEPEVALERLGTDRTVEHTMTR